MNYRTAIPDLVKQSGVRGLYRGYWPLFWRDVPAWATYFWAYDVLKQSFVEEKNWKKNQIMTTLKMMVCAGVAGQLSWIVSYPFDVVKAVI